MDRRVALIAGVLALAACDDGEEHMPTAPVVAAPAPPFVLQASTPDVGTYVSVSCTSDGQCGGLGWTIHVSGMPSAALSLRTLFYDPSGRACAVGTSVYRRINGVDAFHGSSFTLHCDLPFVTDRLGVQLVDSRREAVAGAILPGIGWTFTQLPPRDPI